MSDVTDILTSRINVKRLTSYLLDGITPSYANVVDRQPPRSSRLEVEIWGATIATMGTVTIQESVVASVNEYVLTDRNLVDVWALKIQNGIISIESSIGTPQNNPIIQDSLNPSDHWTVFIENGVINIESTPTVRDDDINLLDTETGSSYTIIVSDGILGITNSNSISEEFVFTSNDVKVGTTQFAAVAQITAVGIAGGSISIRSINNMGQPINQYRTVGTNVPVRFYSQSGRIRMMKQGQDKIAKYKIMAEPDVDIEDNDIIYAVSGIFGLTYGSVEFAERIYDFDGLTHHLEAEIMDL